MNMDNGLFYRFLLWRDRHIPEKHFILIVSFLVGLCTAAAAIILKWLIHTIQHWLTGNFNLEEANYLYLLYPVIGILLAGLFVKYIVRDDISHGVTRISINPQTLEDQVLAAIGRKHSARDILDAYALAREVGFDSINMDLIAGLPRDSFEGFRRSLEGVLALKPENVTVHTLALKKGSRLMEEGGALPSGEETARMLDFSRETLRGAGYLPYYLYRQKYMSGSLENVGWCLSGKESVYNIIMMEELQTVVSIGGGGVTKLVDRKNGRIVRLPNPKYPHDYLASRDKILAQKDEIAAFYQDRT